MHIKVKVFFENLIALVTESMLELLATVLFILFLIFSLFCIKQWSHPLHNMQLASMDLLIQFI